MAAYYNELDPFAADWLEHLIRDGVIAGGEVDRRSILDVAAADLRGFTQCHFFAGIGGWSYALRLAGWPDDRPVWTGSCPCQPFSAAGKQRGSEDERHLWPAFFRLIRECRPATVFGEQVAGAAGLAWLDHVCADLEGEGYAAAAADLPACSVGAPHRRQRLWWVADGAGARSFSSTHAGVHRGQEGAGSRHGEPQRCRADGRMADADGGIASDGNVQRGGKQRLLAPRGGAVGMAHAEQRAAKRWGYDVAGKTCRAEGEARERQRLRDDAWASGDADGCGEVCGLGDSCGDGWKQSANRPSRQEPNFGRPSIYHAWSDLEWLACSDGKARPTQPGLFPLAHGIPGRVGRLRAYGNAIVPQVAAEFIGAVMDVQ